MNKIITILFITFSVIYSSEDLLPKIISTPRDPLQAIRAPYERAIRELTSWETQRLIQAKTKLLVDREKHFQAEKHTNNIAAWEVERDCQNRYLKAIIAQQNIHLPDLRGELMQAMNEQDS